MTPTQIKALAGLAVAGLTALAAFLPDWAPVLTGIAGVLGMLSPGLLSGNSRTS